MASTTFPKYIKNPNIFGTTSPQSKLIIEDYSRRFDAILVREGGKIAYRLFRDDKGNYYWYGKIPSEVIPKFYYDVIIKFKEGVVNKLSPNLKSYDIQVFSNDPAFCYTYAYAFNKNNLFIKDFSDKLGKDFLETRAIVRNPKNDIGIVKSLFFAYFAIVRDDLFNKDNWKNAKTYNSKSISRLIMSADRKIALRQHLGKQLARKERIEKPTTHTPRNQFTATDHVKMAAKPTNISRAHRASAVRKVKTVGRNNKRKK